MIMYLTLKIPQEDRQIRLIIITSFLAVLQLKKTLTKFKSVTIQLILNMRLSAVLCLIWSLAIRVLAVTASSAPLQCIFSHGGIIHFLDVMLHPELVVCLPRMCIFTFTFTFSHLADAFVQSDVQGREQSS